MLLCAGFGTRFLPVTEKVAKPAIPFLNVPLLGYSLFEIEKLQPKNLVINTHHLPRTVELAARELVGAGNAAGAKYNLHFSHEPEILGSGGGIRAAEKFFGADDFVVANGDEVNLFSGERGLLPLLEFHQKSKALATLLTTVHPEAGRTMGGVWANADGLVTRLGEKATDGGSAGGADGAQHFAGVFVFSPRIFEFMPKSGEFHIFRDCLLPAIRAGEKVMAFQDREMLWLDTTSVKSFILSTERALKELGGANFARQLLAVQERFGHQMNRASEKQWLASGARFSGSGVEAYIFMGENSEISAGVEVQNFAVIGNGARFSQGVMDSTVIGANVRINELVHLRRQVIVG